MTAAAQPLQIVIQSDGVTRFIYCETLNLTSLGQIQIRRASHVEPDEDGRWWADLSLAGGPTLGPFERRSEALAAELVWLQRHVIEQR